MLPNIDLRLANCIKALEEVVIPSLSDGERMAREQALLVIGHLRMIGGQWKHALRFETASLDAMSALARTISASDPGFSGELADALGGIETIDRRDIDTVEAAICPCGKSLSVDVQEEQARCVRDLEWSGKRRFLHFAIRRFDCPAFLVPHKPATQIAQNAAIL